MGGLQVAVVLSEKVDSTVTKGVLRIIGSAVGGTFGELPCLTDFLLTSSHHCQDTTMSQHGCRLEYIPCVSL